MPHPEQIDPNVGLWNAGRLYRENMPGRYGVYTDETAALTTAVMTCVGVPLYAGDFISKITVMVGATAAGTPVNQWAALYSSAATPALLVGSQSADGTSTAIGASAALTFTLATPQLITAEGIYYAAIMVKATTVPSLVCNNTGVAVIAGAVLTGQAIRAQTSGSALTTTAPATIASPTTVAKVPYVVLS
jgi:hypothetical protein